MRNATRSEKLDLRLTPKAKKTLQAAAAAARRSVSDFVLESALARADEALAERQEFRLSPAKWRAFVEALDTPPRKIPEMERLLKGSDFFSGGKKR